MADNTYVVDSYPSLFPPRPAVADDGTGIDWIVINGTFERSEINLGYRLDGGVATAASGFISAGFASTFAFVEVSGVIENARGGDGSDTIQGNERANVLQGDRTGAGGRDSLYGRAGDDTLLGGAGNDDLRGDGDNDVIVGGTGDDFILGGAGNDTVEGGRGADRIDGGGEAGDVLTYATSQTGVNVQTTTDAAFGAACRGGDAQGDAVGQFATIVGTRFDDRIRDIDPFDAGEASSGTTTNDNTFQGGAGADVLRLGGGDDLGLGGVGGDTILGEAGRDTLVGEDGNDILAGGTGADQLAGGAGVDVLAGGDGNDILAGGTEGDRLAGGVGADVLAGGAGNDRLLGEAGADRLAGGLGADLFVFAAPAQSPAGPGRDRVLDFQAGVDDIALAAIDANAGLAGNQAFRLDAGGALSAGEIRQVAVAGGDLLLLMNTDGDAAAEMSILVENRAAALGAGSFVF